MVLSRDRYLPVARAQTWRQDGVDARSLLTSPSSSDLETGCRCRETAIYQSLVLAMYALGRVVGESSGGD